MSVTAKKAFLAFAGIFSVAAGTVSDHATEPTLLRRTDVCNSAKCQDYAKFIKDSLATNYEKLDPCVEFDKYSCKGWQDTHQYRPDQTSVSVTSVISDTNRDLLHAILEGEYADNSTFTGSNKYADQENFSKMKTLYNACKNEDYIKSYGFEPLKKILQELNTVYPSQYAKTYANSSNDELTRAISWLYKKTSISGLVSSSPTPDDMNPDTMIISVGSGRVELAKAYYNKSVVMTNYTRAIAQMYQVIETGKSIDEEPIPTSRNASLYEKAERIVAFEKKMAENSPDPEITNDIKYYYTLKTLSELYSMIPEISWSKYLASSVPSGYDLSPNRTLIVGDIDYFKSLSNLIRSTPRETIHDYLEFRIISGLNGRIDKTLGAPLRRFNNMLVGKDPDASPLRWRTCLSEVDGILGHSLGASFIERAFSQKDKNLGDQIITDIKGVFAQNLKTLDWMSEEAKKVAANKVSKMIQKVGFQTKNPSEQNPEELRTYYSSLSVGTNYFFNGISAVSFGLNQTWALLSKPTDRDQWDMTSPTVNAYFNPPLNEIVFPAGIMQTPNFNGDLPEYVSYGAFGATVGHELTHGFDDNGSKYDDTGRYREWWDNLTTVAFDKKTECFIQQYGQYSVEGLDGEKVPVNGKLTQGENIADGGGLKAAYNAWKKREIASGAPNPGLPGLEKFTNDQLFFISYGNSWCEKTRKEALLKQVLSDPHSPADTRITGPVENSVDFKKAFNCPAKVAKCDLW